MIVEVTEQRLHLAGTDRWLGAADVDWASYLGDSASSHHSPLHQVNASNVRRLRVAWTYHARGPIESSPLVKDGQVFFGDSDTNFYALNAADVARAAEIHVQPSQLTTVVVGDARWRDALGDGVETVQPEF